ncbi:glycylpeptide N-tetradecanoyltransferase [Zalerion maritima]|uniref:Glycylpeptide N-tetradecanoyltransferase n=1 Tax=Zalerion maritima TaxID=339359 RepID=A0AAD5RIU7_9PEZI|nr:glycylpeptide N-tetradecanoyltransferase [Zalerion maritima]
MSPKYPTQKETLSHPAYPTAIFRLRPRLSGLCPVATTRPNGPLQIGYSIHGTGPIKLVFIMGLAGTQISWQRQTLHFGHVNAAKYSILTIDNRGMGVSSAPLARYSTSEMAHDVLELLDFLSWTSPRSVHLVGISLGGMISQELCIHSPSRFASVSFISTAAEMANTGGLSEGLGRMSMLVPKSLDQTLLDTSKELFPPSWLQAEDACLLPDPSKHPDVDPPASSKEGETVGKEYLRFESNFQRWQAQELHKRLSPSFTKTGFLMQLIAAGWHKKTPAQLKEMADRIGRERILVFHGLDDEMINPVLGRRLAEAVKPGKEIFEEGLGHAAPVQAAEWFNEMLEKHFAQGERINQEMAV